MTKGNCKDVVSQWTLSTQNLIVLCILQLHALHDLAHREDANELLSRKSGERGSQAQKPGVFNPSAPPCVNITCANQVE